MNNKAPQGTVNAGGTPTVFAVSHVSNVIEEQKDKTMDTMTVLKYPVMPSEIGITTAVLHK